MNFRVVAAGAVIRATELGSLSQSDGEPGSSLGFASYARRKNGRSQSAFVVSASRKELDRPRDEPRAWAT